MIGLDRVAGAFGDSDLAAWAKAGGTLARIPQLDVKQAQEGAAKNTLALIDVRGHSEWEGGHAPGVPNIPWPDIAERVNEVAEGRGIALMCQTGSRSSIAASLLLARGYPNVVNITGGFSEWQRAGLPVETPGA
jgi:hydroxyacylglutathione hydrolase